MVAAGKTVTRIEATPFDRSETPPSARRLVRTTRGAAVRLREAARTAGHESAAALCEDLSRKRQRYSAELAALLDLPTPSRERRRSFPLDVGSPAATLRGVAHREETLRHGYEAALDECGPGPLRDLLARHLAEIRRDAARLDSLRDAVSLRPRFTWPADVERERN